jgi:8-amino-3,8-dideoxy-alpha-D-manno-octulosonate transaminase
MPGFELIGNEEFEEVKDIFEHSKVLFRHSFDNIRNGIYKVRDLEREFSKYMGVKNALAVTSGSAALKVALESLGIKEGDEVITQSFTFVATVEAIIECRGTPIIAEIDETLNMDPSDLEKKITEKTKAIIVVHMLGTPARMDKIMEIALRYNIPVIEDTAWGCGGKFGEKHLGTIGTIGTFSFDFAKGMTTGEGGMVVTDNDSIYSKAAAYHDHGHENNSKVPRWEDTRSGSGFNYRMSELQGAVGLAQLKKLPRLIEGQRANKKMIEDILKDYSQIKLREVPEGSYETAEALVFLVDSNLIARKIREELLKVGLGTKILPEAITWHFAGTWDHMPSLVKANGGNLATAFPQSLAILSRSVALPIFFNMDSSYPKTIRKVLTSIFGE